MATKKDEQAMESDFFVQDADELEQALDEIPRQDSQIRVFRMQAQGNLKFIRSYYPDDFNLDMLREEHGGGRYKIVPRVAGRTLSGHRIEIEGEPIIQQKTEIVRNIEGKWLTKEERAKAEQEAAERSMQGGKVDPIVLMLLQEIRDMKANLQNANSGGSRLEFYKELAAMKEIFGPTQSQSNIDTQSIMGLITKGLELGRDAANGDLPGKDSSVWGGVIEKLIPIASQALTALANKPQPVPPHMAGNPPAIEPLPRQGIADILPDSGKKPMVNGETKLHPFVIQLAPYIELMMRDAAGNSDPSIWAELIASRIPPNQHSSVLEWLNGSTWRNDLVQLNPGIQLQAAWFEGLNREIISFITDPANSGDDNDEIRQ